MENLPTTFDEALDMAIVAAQKYVRTIADADFAALHFERAKRNLEYAQMAGFSDKVIAQAEEAFESAGYQLDCCDHFRGHADDAIHCWSSGYHYTLSGKEIWADVCYYPRRFRYLSEIYSEGGCEGSRSFKRREAAMDWAVDMLHAD